MNTKLLFSFLFLIFASCSTNKSVQSPKSSQTIDLLSTNAVSNNDFFANYKASEPKINDLINTDLDLHFDIPKKHVLGTANITLKPHFYATDSLTLDARGFVIHSVNLIEKDKTEPLKFDYQSPKLKIRLNRKYSNNEQYVVSIKYTAKPAELAKGASSYAVTDDRGMYFFDVNTDSPQIWTQGETSSNSCWFPTIDAPNQKMTQQFKITVPRNLQTLSNGKFITSLLNEDGTRTDLWRQTLPHAPYLAMIAVGKFTVIHNSWRDLPLDVYVATNDEKNAKVTFAKTSKMIDFYSRCFNFDFPWDKYSQIVVKNFVSGAMENTSATVFGDYVLRNNETDILRENESVVAHELSHHWFGDLITCESWANTVLNEGFATYSEYLWFEHEYGREEADLHLSFDYLYYQYENYYKQANLVRFDYRNEGDMFDRHSYQKGALVLHMLRTTVGDGAFFKAFNLYLEKHKFQSVEIHDLRLAFEEVTGKDMNWFFNQWFLDKGFPVLDINYSYNEQSGISSVVIEQTQNLNTQPVFVAPLKIAFWLKDTIVYKNINLEKQVQTFQLKTDEKPEFIDFDNDNSLLCKFTENKTKDEYLAQLSRAPLFDDKIAALSGLQKYSENKEVQRAFIEFSRNGFWYYRYLACDYFSTKKSADISKEIIERLTDMSREDENPAVKNRAAEKLNSR